MPAPEGLKRALDLKDKVAVHADGGEFEHHVHAPIVQAVRDLTDVDPEMDSPRPNGDRIKKALDVKERMQAHGLAVPLSAEEGLWRQEVSQGLHALDKH